MKKPQRWTARRKAAIVLDVLKGTFTAAQAYRAHGVTQDELQRWSQEYQRGGLAALKNENGGETAHRAEIRRLQAKIDALVMENEIRKEAMRPFTSVEPMLHGSRLDDDGPKP